MSRSLPSPTLRDLELVRLLLEEAGTPGHYARASKRSGAHTSQISAALDRVEYDLRVGLMATATKRRTSRMTKAGEALLSDLPAIIDAWERLRRVLGEREALIVSGRTRA